MRLSSVDGYSILLQLTRFTPHLFLLSSLSALFLMVIKSCCVVFLRREGKFDEAKRELALVFLFFICFLIGMFIYFWLSFLMNQTDFPK